jgi:acetyl-CoA synthetase
MTRHQSEIHLSAVDDLLQETRVFPPPGSFQKNAVVKDPDIYKKAAEDRLAYWDEAAGRLEWFEKWTRTLEWEPPFAKWFVDGKLNACYNCLDRHVKNGLGGRAAILWEGEPGDSRRLSYDELLAEVNRLSGGLKKLGVRKGDRVAVYLPLVPEAVCAMLACARIGAIHTVVFGGFSVDSLRDRVLDAQARVLITADGGYRRGKIIPLKETADKAAAVCPSIEHLVVVRRTGAAVNIKPGRDHWYHDLIESAEAYCEPEPMDAEDILFILYTSGTTGKPKGIIHTTGGYMTGVAETARTVFDLKDADVFWCTADVGWVTGHSYIVYGPMANAATQVMYEGTPDHPGRGRFWEIIEKYRVSVFYTAPTAIRAFMKWGEQWPRRHDLSSLRLLGSVGEPINPEAWMWYHEVIGRERCPVVDTWWQTETGCAMISPLPGITAAKPGSATRALPGIDAEVLTDAGKPVTQGGGFLAITSPWPSMLRGIWGDRQRFIDTYWGKWPGVYFPGDGAKRDAEGYFWLLGRVDDVMNVAGHNIGTAEVESALVDHRMVAEAAVVGITDEIKGQAIAAFVILREGNDPTLEAEEELRGHVVEKIGAIARPKNILFTADLPKTRSGKIMRRLLRDIAEGRALGDVTTLADPAVIEALKQKYEEA